MKDALLIHSWARAREYAASAAGVTNDGFVAYTRALQDAGLLVAAEQLTHTDTATSVRVRGEDRLVTDGPFMETKENLRGLYLMQVPDLDTALTWAGRIAFAAR